MPLKSRLFFALIAIMLVSASAQAIRIRELSIREDTVNYLSPFHIDAELSGDTCNYIAHFYVNEYRMPAKNIPCDTDLVSAKLDLVEDDWDRLRITCGQATAKVEILTQATQHLVESEQISFDIGVVPDVIFIPHEPTPGRPVRVKLTHPETGNSLRNVRVIVKDIYGGDPISRRTAADGTFEFTPSVAGEYRMQFRERDICGEMKFWIKRPLLVDGPRPEKPVVGEMIQAAVPAQSGVGVKVFDSQGNVYSTLQAALNGGVNFTVSDPGSYTLAFGEISTKFWPVNKTLEVLSRAVPTVRVAPEKPVVGRPVTITVATGTSPIANAKVVIAGPDGIEREFTTNTFGTLTYEGVTSTGLYEVKATFDRLDTGSATFTAKNELRPSFEPERLSVGEAVTLTVKNQNSEPLTDVLVEISQLNERKVTDMQGRLEINLPEPVKYDFKLSKELFWDSQLSITPYGMLTFGEIDDVIRLGENITISVIDRFSRPQEAEILIRKPSGIVLQFAGSSHRYVPDNPGEYEVSLRKTNYESESMNFTVLPYAYDMDADMSAGNLRIRLTRLGEPLPYILVSAQVGSDTLEKTTNSEGVATFSVTREGEVHLTVNPANDNTLYEQRSETIDVVRSYDIVLLTGPIILIAVISLMAIISIQLGRRFFQEADGDGGESKGQIKKSRHQHSIVGQEGSNRKCRLSDI